MISKTRYNSYLEQLELMRALKKAQFLASSGAMR
jgi:hypothetical protein